LIKIKVQILFSVFLTTFFYASEPFAEKKIGKEYSIVEKKDVDIIIDGLLLEKEWSDLDLIDDYAQSYPINMAPPSFKTETRLFYTSEGIYIFSRMFDDEPSKIQQRLANRDDYEDGFLESADWIYFSFDSRHDHQTGYVFAVNCSGVQLDAAIYDDEGFDFEYNSIWYSETNIDEKGWTVEIMIPFSALRFDSEVNETWGFDSKRYIFRLDEIDNWMVFPPEVPGVSSKYGHILGFQNIKSFKSIQLAPYASFNGTIEKESELALNSDGAIIRKDSLNQYDQKYNQQDFGVDLKYNISTSTTIDISYNPDFGQVEVDPADINISYYETYLDEKRPFFTENSMLFSLPIEMFYSRRIGEFKDLNNYNIDIPTTIDYAAKLSGKQNNGFSFGLISALTSNQVHDSLNISPYVARNKYNVIKLKQDILNGNSFWGLMVSNYNGLRGNYVKNFSTNTYELDENTPLDVSTYSIDCKHSLFDNRLITDFQYSISSLNNEGHANYFNASYNINEYWTTFLSHEYINASFDNNDIGYTKRNDINSRGIGLMYHDLDGSDIFVERTLSFNYITQKNVSNNLILNEQMSLSARMDLFNNNSFVINFIRSLEGADDRLLYDLREDKLGMPMYIPAYNIVSLSWDSDFREQVSFSTYLSYKKNSINDYQYSFKYSQVYRPTYNFKMSFDYKYRYLKEKYHWLETITVEDEPHYIFSNINATLQKFVLRFDAFINKDFTIQSYTEFIKTDDNLSDWTELLNGRFPENSDFINQDGGFGGYSIYADEGQNPQNNQQANPNNDPFFFSKYNEVIFNLILKWKFNQRSDFYFVYTRYWLVNGKKFDSFFDFLEYSGDESWVEKSFDQGISIKYSYKFDI